MTTLDSKLIQGQIKNMAMYLLQTYINQGLEQKQACNRVVEDLTTVVKEYLGTESYNQISVNILVDQAINQIKNKAPREVVLNTLINIKMIIKKREDTYGQNSKK